MKFFIVFAILVAAALAAPVDDSQTIVLNYKSDVGTDAYRFNYQTSDGVSRFEEGILKDTNLSKYSAWNVRGSVTWTAKEGEQYTLNYTADENGFQPEGTHLPARQ